MNRFGTNCLLRPGKHRKTFAFGKKLKAATGILSGHLKIAQKCKIKSMLSMRYRLFSVCSAFAKDYVAHAQCTFKSQSMRLIIRFYLNHHKNFKIQKNFKNLS
jgi:hypothetical protein